MMLFDYEVHWANPSKLFCSFEVSQQEKGNKDMKNKFSISRTNNINFASYEEAEAAAKQWTAKNDEVYAIMQAVALTKTVVPDIEVTKL